MELVGLSKENIEKISKVKHEEQWVLDYRLKSYEIFQKLDMPSFGPKYNLDFDKVIYYKNDEDTKMKNNWDNIDQCVKDEF